MIEKENKEKEDAFLTDLESLISAYKEDLKPVQIIELLLERGVRLSIDYASGSKDRNALLVQDYVRALLYAYSEAGA